MLDFQNMEILGAGRVKTAKIRYCAKFREIVKPLLKYGDFSILKHGAAATLDFKIFENLTIGTVKSVELRDHAKFWRNRSNRG